jgi:hypothetical protein
MGWGSREREHRAKTGVKQRYYVKSDGIFYFSDVFVFSGSEMNVMRRRVMGSGIEGKGEGM